MTVNFDKGYEGILSHSRVYWSTGWIKIQDLSLRNDNSKFKK